MSYCRNIVYWANNDFLLFYFIVSPKFWFPCFWLSIGVACEYFSNGKNMESSKIQIFFEPVAYHDNMIIVIIGTFVFKCDCFCWMIFSDNNYINARKFDSYLMGTCAQVFIWNLQNDSEKNWFLSTSNHQKLVLRCQDLSYKPM